jgi:pentatricopeptide repeat protein
MLFEYLNSIFERHCASYSEDEDCESKGGYVHYFTSNLSYSEAKNIYEEMVEDGCTSKTWFI